MSTAVITVEGILGEQDVIQGFHPIIEGMKLVRTFRSQYQCIFSTVSPDPDSMENWLMIAGLVKIQDYEILAYRERRWVDLDESTLRVEQLRDLRSREYQVGLFLSADPMAVLQATATGVPALLYAHPAYGWQAFRPDRNSVPRSWAEIEDEVTHQRALKATDPRLVEARED